MPTRRFEGGLEMRAVRESLLFQLVPASLVCLVHHALRRCSMSCFEESQRHGEWLALRREARWAGPRISRRSSSSQRGRKLCLEIVVVDVGVGAIPATRSRARCVDRKRVADHRAMRLSHVATQPTAIEVVPFFINLNAQGVVLEHNSDEELLPFLWLCFPGGLAFRQSDQCARPDMIPQLA